MQRVREIVVLGVWLLAIASFAYAQELGKPSQESHAVSIEELWGNSSFFDEQPVTVVGVADLGVGFEARPKLYSSLEAFEHRTDQYISVWFSDDWIEKYADILESLRGKYVRLDAKFSYSPREKIDESDEGFTICLGDCASPGTLYDIRYIVLRD